MDPYSQRRTIGTIARHLEDEFEINQAASNDRKLCASILCCCFGKRCGFYLTVLYISVRKS